MKFHAGTFATGIVFLAIGVAFMLEALGVWRVRLADLRLIGPIALVLIGLAVIFGSMRRRPS